MQTIATFIGFFGVMKYFLDRALIYTFEQVRSTMKESIRKGLLTSDDQQRILAETATRLWDYSLLAEESRNVTFWSRLGLAAGSLYQYVVPGPIRTILFIPTYLLTYPVRLFVEKKHMKVLRKRTREMALSGLWSFLVPLVFGILTASALVQEVEYVKIVNGKGPDGPEIKQHTIKRVVIGPGRFSFSLPHHPVIYTVSYAIVLFAVFHTISFFFLLYTTLAAASAAKSG